MELSKKPKSLAKHPPFSGAEYLKMFLPKFRCLTTFITSAKTNRDIAIDHFTSEDWLPFKRDIRILISKLKARRLV